MKKPPELVKSERIILRVTKAEKAQLEDWLKQHPDMDMSQLLRTLLYTKIMPSL